MNKRSTGDDVERAAEMVGAELAQGPKPASDIEDPAEKRGVPPAALESAKKELKVTASRLNSGHGNAVH